MPFTPPALPLSSENQKNLNVLNDTNIQLEKLNMAVQALISGTPVLQICEELGLDHPTLTAAIKTALRQRTLEFETQAETYQALVVSRLEMQWSVAHMRGMGQPKDPNDPESHYIPGDVRWMAEARLTLAALTKILAPYLKKTEENIERGATKVLNPTIFKGSDLFLIGNRGAAGGLPHGGLLSSYADMTPQDLIRDDVENSPEYEGVQVLHGRSKKRTDNDDPDPDEETPDPGDF